MILSGAVPCGVLLGVLLGDGILPFTLQGRLLSCQEMNTVIAA